MATLKELQVQELLGPGHRLCAGCGGAITARMTLKAIKRPMVVVNATGCLEVATTIYPYTAWGVPWVHGLFENNSAIASGIETILKAKNGGKLDTDIIVFGGDGGTFDIGLQALSGAFERRHDFVYVCYDNEAYMNTGIQSSSSTPQNTWTMTTPGGRRGRKKKFMQIIAAHRMPYAATASIGHPEDLMEKIRKAKGIKGMKFIHTLTPCPTGWRMPEHLSARAAQLAVETRIFPLYEVIDGRDYRITHEPKGLPVDDYVRMQGRFRHFTPDDIRRLQEEVDEEWALLKGMTKGCLG